MTGRARSKPFMRGRRHAANSSTTSRSCTRTARRPTTSVGQGARPSGRARARPETRVPAVPPSAESRAAIRQWTPGARCGRDRALGCGTPSPRTRRPRAIPGCAGGVRARGRAPRRAGSRGRDAALTSHRRRGRAITHQAWGSPRPRQGATQASPPRRRGTAALTNSRTRPDSSSTT